MKDTQKDIDDKSLYLAFAFVFGIGQWKEYLVIDGVLWEARKSLFPFCIAMRFKKLGRVEEQE